MRILNFEVFSTPAGGRHICILNLTRTEYAYICFSVSKHN